MYKLVAFRDIISYVSRITRRDDITTEIFGENSNLWLINLNSILQYDDCLFIPFVVNLLKYCCSKFIINKTIKTPQKFICLFIINPSIIALQRLVTDRLLLYKTLVNLENIIRFYNIKHEFLCKILSLLTQLLVDIEYFNVINNSHGLAPAHVLRLSINSLCPFTIRLTNSKCCYWTGLFNSLLRIKLEFTVSNVILNLEIAAVQESKLPLLIAETFKVLSMVTMLQQYSSLDLYINRISALKERLISKYCLDNLTPVMNFYRVILIDLANHKYHNADYPGITNNKKLVVFNDLNKTAFTTIMPQYIRLLVRLYMIMMLKLPKIGYSCKRCRDLYIQQHLHFIYEIMDYTKKTSKKIGEWMNKDPVSEFEAVIITIKSIIICLVGSEHILSINWFSHAKKLPSDVSEMLHSIAFKYSPCKAMLSTLRDMPVPFDTPHYINIDERPIRIPSDVLVSVFIDNEWVDVTVMQESHLLVFRDSNLLVSIVDLRLVSGITRNFIPPEHGKMGYLLKLIMDEWRFGGVERLDGLCHQPFVSISTPTKELRDLFFTALKLLLDNFKEPGDWWLFPKYRHYDSETELALHFEDEG